MKQLLDTLEGYFALTKPGIMLLVLITGAAALVLEGSLAGEPTRFALALLLLALAGGSANAFNQYFERDVDAAMARTAGRRPLPQRRVTPTGAFIFAVMTGAASTAFFFLWFNPFAALLSLATILFYSLFYTLYLKPRTPQNIVIGGAAGAMAPVIAWAAASGGTSLQPWLMFAVIFFWTPPHFWSLAYCLKEDYRRVKYPMLPLVLEDTETWRRILHYTLVTLAFSLLLWLAGGGGIYLTAAVLLGWLFLRRALRAGRSPSAKAAWGMFSFSIIYLLALFTALMVDRGINL